MEIFDIIKNTNIISNSNKAESDLHYNFDNIMKIVQMMKIMQSTQKNPEESENTLEINNSSINSIKFILPYLNLPRQQNIDIIIKLVEMKNIINYYKNTVTTVSLEKKATMKKNALLAIKPNLNKEKQTFVDAFIKVLEGQEIKDEFKENENECRL